MSTLIALAPLLAALAPVFKPVLDSFFQAYWSHADAPLDPTTAQISLDDADDDALADRLHDSIASVWP